MNETKRPKTDPPVCSVSVHKLSSMVCQGVSGRTQVSCTDPDLYLTEHHGDELEFQLSARSNHLISVPSGQIPTATLNIVYKCLLTIRIGLLYIICSVHHELLLQKQKHFRILEYPYDILENLRINL